MDSESDAIWSRRFTSIVLSNGFFFAGFHMLLPTVPLLAIAMGGTKTEVGLVAGVFVLSSVITRLFTDLAVRCLGPRNSLILGIVISLASALSYIWATSVGALLWIRLLHGAGFGIGTTFYVSVVTDYVPAARRGEGLGYFGLATTIAMAVAPATGLWVVQRFGFEAMFILAVGFELVAMVWLLGCSFDGVGGNSAAPRKPSRPSMRAFAGVAVERGTGLPAGLTVLFGCAYGSVLNFLAVYAQEKGLANAGAFFFVATVCIFVARLTTARVYDRKGEAWLLVPGSACLSVGLFLLSQSASTGLFFLAAAFFGAGVGMTFPALQTGTIDRVRRDRRSGASATFSNALDVGIGGGSVALGFLAQHSGLVTTFLTAAAIGAMVPAVYGLATLVSRREPLRVSTRDQ